MPIDVRLLAALEHFLDVEMKEAGTLLSQGDLELERADPPKVKVAGPSLPQKPPQAVESADAGSSVPAQVEVHH